jgi:hypothetical protein
VGRGLASLFHARRHGHLGLVTEAAARAQAASSFRGALMNDFTDFYGIEQLLNDAGRDAVRRTREFMTNEVLL